MFKSVLFLVLMIFVSSCEKDSASMDTNLYFSYFPMESGTYVDYEVVEIQHDVNAAVTSDTSSYFLRTVIGDTVTDNQGRLSRKFIRKKRDSNNDIWEISDVWTTIIDQNRVEVVEENKRKVWLVLPPLSTTIWDLNAYNMLPNVSCNYEGIHDSFEMNGLQFDSVLTVEQENVLNLISFRRKYAQYANHVGLVNWYYKDLNISNFDTLNIQSGSEFMYKCIDFGIE
ncbi:MAG: hypothetical protein P8M87_00125 [Crocinitomicaceae bacterium]|nr:hypothetical protein [Crocinitomicaceae bacterium]